MEMTTIGEDTWHKRRIRQHHFRQREIRRSLQKTIETAINRVYKANDPLYLDAVVSRMSWMLDTRGLDIGALNDSALTAFIEEAISRE